MSTDRIITERVVSAMFDQNAYLVWKHGETKAVAIDPGFDVESLIGLIHSNQLTLAAIWLTHGHADHIIGLERLKKAFPDAPIVIGVNEAALLTDPELNLSLPMGFPVVAPKADRTVVDGEQFEEAGMKVRVLEIPGHSPGSVVFVIENPKPNIAFVGDVIFAGSVGRADFKGGDGRQLITGIRSKLFAFDDDTLLFPGHGPSTTIGQEQQTNPFVGYGVKLEF